MKYDNFGHLTQEQQLAVVLGADYEAEYKGEWFPGQQIIPSNKTEFRIAPKDWKLQSEAREILNKRQA
jgi:hypothetical protein